MALPFKEDSCGVPSMATDCVLVDPFLYLAITDENNIVLDSGYNQVGVTTCGRVGYEWSNLKLYIGNEDQTIYDGDTATYTLAPSATLVQFMPCIQGSYPKDIYYGVLTQTGKDSRDIFYPLSSSTAQIIETSIFPIIMIGVAIFLIWFGYQKFRSYL